MLKIGEFARIIGIPISTLRYYDEVGLLHPAHTNPRNNYRYYNHAQLHRIARIIALREMGLSIDETRRLLAEGTRPTDARALLRGKRDDLQQQIASLQHQLSYLAHKVREMEADGRMSAYEVILSPLEDMYVASVRRLLPDRAALEAGIDRMAEKLRGCVPNPAGPVQVLFHDLVYPDTDLDIEVVVPVKRKPQGDDEVVWRKVAGGWLARVFISREEQNSGRAYVELRSWIDANHYRVAGPMREVWLETAPGAHLKKPIRELGFWVEKKEATR